MTYVDYLDFKWNFCILYLYVSYPREAKTGIISISVCLSVPNARWRVFCVHFSRGNAFTNFNGTFSFSSIHAWKGYFKMSYSFWNEWRLFKNLLWYGFGHNFSPLCSCGYIQNLIVFGCYMFYIIILKFCISTLGIERLLFRLYSFQSWRGVRSSCAGVGTSFTMSCLSCLSWFA